MTPSKQYQHEQGEVERIAAMPRETLNDLKARAQAWLEFAQGLNPGKTAQPTKRPAGPVTKG